MAITWVVKIKVVDLARKEASVTATRTDDSVDPPKVFTKTIKSVLVDTTVKPLVQIRANVIDMIWADYQEKVEAEQGAAALLEGWESVLESDLDAKEIE